MTFMKNIYRTARLAATGLGAGEQRRARYGSIALFAVALVLIIGGLQSLSFQSQFTPWVKRANAMLVSQARQVTRAEIVKEVKERFRSLVAAVDIEDEAAKRLREALNSVEQAPDEMIRELRAELDIVEEGLSETGADPIDQLRNEVNRLEEAYADPYERLQEALKSPPWYLWPMANVLSQTSGYVDAVTFNRAIYLASVGETGTARVLLSSLHARADDPELLGLVYYTLGRIHFEVFRSSPDPESYSDSVQYMQAVQYLRQSLQADPDSTLAKRFHDYLLSLPPLKTTATNDEMSTPTEGRMSERPRIF